MAKASPCTQLCSLDAESGWCLGCLRSIEEIATWGALDDAGKERVLAAVESRRMGLRHPERSEGSAPAPSRDPSRRSG